MSGGTDDLGHRRRGQDGSSRPASVTPQGRIGTGSGTAAGTGRPRSVPGCPRGGRGRYAGYVPPPPGDGGHPGRLPHSSQHVSRRSGPGRGPSAHGPGGPRPSLRLPLRVTPPNREDAPPLAEVTRGGTHFRIGPGFHHSPTRGVHAEHPRLLAHHRGGGYTGFPTEKIPASPGWTWPTWERWPRRC